MQVNIDRFFLCLRRLRLHYQLCCCMYVPSFSPFLLYIGSRVRFLKCFLRIGYSMYCPSRVWLANQRCIDQEGQYTFLF